MILTALLVVKGLVVPVYTNDEDNQMQVLASYLNGQSLQVSDYGDQVFVQKL